MGNSIKKEIAISDAEKYSKLAEQLSGFEKRIEAFILNIL